MKGKIAANHLTKYNFGFPIDFLVIKSMIVCLYSKCNMEIIVKPIKNKLFYLKNEQNIYLILKSKKIDVPEKIY